MLFIYYTNWVKYVELPREQYEGGTHGGPQFISKESINILNERLRKYTGMAETQGALTKNIKKWCEIKN